MTTILIADDRTSIREYCRMELEDEGYQVIAAADGAEAICLASSHTPDLVVLDICMPGVNGLEAMRRIRANQPDTPIVFFTSYADMCAEGHSFAGAAACVDKCEDLTELKRVIAAALRSHRHGHSYRLGLPLTNSAGPGKLSGHGAAVQKGALGKCSC